MTRFHHTLLSFQNDEEGATAIEYGLIAALVCVTLITSLTFFGGKLRALLDYVGVNFPI